MAREIKGLDQLLVKLKRLPPNIQRKAFRPAARKAMNIIRNDAKARALRLDDPATAESIAKNIVTQESNRRGRRIGGIVMRVGVLGGARKYAPTKDNVRKRRVGKTYAVGGDKGNPGGDTFYWRFLEFGTSKMPSRPFMRPAMNNNENRVLDVFVADAARSMDKVITENAAANR